MHGTNNYKHQVKKLVTNQFSTDHFRSLFLPQLIRIIIQKEKCCIEGPTVETYKSLRSSFQKTVTI